MRRLLIIFLLSSCASFAQEDFSFTKDSLDYNVFKETVPLWRMEKNLKFSPFDVFSAVPAIGADLETKMKDGLHFQYGAAFIPSFMQFLVGPQQEQFNWMNGYRLRFESRFYKFQKENLYVSTELSARHLIISDDIRIGMEGDGEGNFAYFINERSIIHRFSTHFNFKVGAQRVLADNLVLDLYAGLSFRRNNVLNNAEYPEEGEPQISWNRFDWNLQDGHKFGYAMPIVGVRLGFHWSAKGKI